MEKRRLEILLFNAIDLLLNMDYTREQIMNELGMSEEEFEKVGDDIG